MENDYLRFVLYAQTFMTPDMNVQSVIIIVVRIYVINISAEFRAGMGLSRKLI